MFSQTPALLHFINLAVFLLLFSGCSTNDPNWRAPVETRTVGATTENTQPTPYTPTKPSWRSQATILPPISSAAKFYTIQKGDTLFSIAWRSENQVEELANWNDIKSPYVIYPGQRLRLSAPAKPKPPAATPSQPKAPTQPPKPVTPVKPPVIQPVRPGTLSWQWPLQGKLVSSYKAGDALRKGIKISGKPGAIIRASEGGRVIYSGNGLIGYGLLLIIKHNDKYLSAYGHNRKLLVKKGQKITKGQKIAELGTTNAGETHLHFEIRRSGKPVNPLSLLPK